MPATWTLPAVLSMVTVPAVPPNTADAGVALSQATLLVPLNQFVVAALAVQVPLPPLPFGPHCNWAIAEAGTARQARTAASRDRVRARAVRAIMRIRLQRGWASAERRDS